MNSIKLEEGFGLLSLDYVMALRIIKYLWQDYTNTDAFKLGIIDKDGKKIRNPSSLAEKSAYSPFVRLVLNLKRTIGLLPGGKSQVGSMIAAYALMKESIHSLEEQSFLDEILLEVIEGKISLTESLQRYMPITEDVPVNVTSGATSASTGGFAAPLKKSISVLKRTKPIPLISPTILNANKGVS